MQFTGAGALIELIGRVIDIMETNRMNHDQKLHEHVERIEILEQDKMHQEKVIQEQARKIEELESKVNHEHFWRVTMIDAPILDLKEKWTQIDQFMCSRIQEAESYKELISQSEKKIFKQQASLEQAQSRSDGIIAAPVKKIESLEAAVEKLTSRLKNQQQQQAKQHEANLRRIKQTDIAVTHIREKWRQMDSFWQNQLQPVKGHHTDPSFLEDSSDEEEFAETARQNVLDCSDKQELNSVIKEEPSFLVISELQPKDEEEEFQMKQSQLRILNEFLEKNKGESTKSDIPAITSFAASLQIQLDTAGRTGDSQSCTTRQEAMPSSTMLDVKAHTSNSEELMDSANSLLRGKDGKEMVDPGDVYTLDNDPWGSLCTTFSTERKEQGQVPATKTQTTSGTGSSYALKENLSGNDELPYEPQLTACVNLINVQPFLKKIEEHEIRNMHSRKKGKLKQQWVPIGMFDIKEVFEMVLQEEHSANMFMSQWKKRMRQNPTTHDSCD